MIERAVFLGSTSQVRVRLPHGAVVQSLVTNTSAPRGLETGQAVSVRLPFDALRVLSASPRSSSDESPSGVPAEV